MTDKWTAADAAKAWGLTTSAIRKLITRGRIVGLEMKIIDSKATWTFPAQPKPAQLKTGPKPKNEPSSNP